MGMDPISQYQYTNPAFLEATKKTAGYNAGVQTGGYGTGVQTGEQFHQGRIQQQGMPSTLPTVVGIPKTEDMEMLLALQEQGIDFSNPYDFDDSYDAGYKTYQAFKNDPTTQQYAQYDRELYPVSENRTYAMA